jgi:hypothetical protein
MKSAKYFLLFIIILGISACNTTIYPEENNTFSSVTNSSMQSSAESNAQKDAENYCKKRGKSLAVIKHQTNYYGTTTGNKIAGAILGGIIGMSNPAVSSSDYEVKMRFRCK